MDYKALLQELCTRLERELNRRDPRPPQPRRKSVTLTSEARPIGLVNHMQMAWFVEIKVDGVITHKQVLSFKKGNESEAEQATAWNLLWEVFATGVMFDKREIDRRKGPQPHEERIQKMAKAYATAELTDKEKAVAERAFLMGAAYAGSLQGETTKIVTDENRN